MVRLSLNLRTTKSESLLKIPVAVYAITSLNSNRRSELSKRLLRTNQIYIRRTNQIFGQAFTARVNLTAERVRRSRSNPRAVRGFDRN